MDKTKEEPKLEYYTIEVEAMIPATLKYKILAKSAEEAFAGLSKAFSLQPPKLNLTGMKRLSARVYNYGTKILKYSKKF